MRYYHIIVIVDKIYFTKDILFCNRAILKDYKEARVFSKV